MARNQSFIWNACRKNLPQQVPDSSTQPPVPESADTKVQQGNNSVAMWTDIKNILSKMTK